MHCRTVTDLDRKLTRIYVAVFLLVAMNAGWLFAEAHGETFVGKALNSKGTVEYVERHTVTYKDGRPSESETIYFDDNNRIIGDLISEYSFGPQFGSYHFRDVRANYEDGAEVSAEKIRIFRKKSAEEDIEERFLNQEQDQIVGQGFHQFISYNTDQIAEGEVFHVRLVLPSRLDQFKFRIRKRDIKGDTIYIRLEIDNWFLRLFAPHIDVEYDLRTRRLLRYEGVSNLEDDSGKHRKVTITYTYEN
jgi:hypothetical protein